MGMLGSFSGLFTGAAGAAGSTAVADKAASLAGKTFTGFSGGNTATGYSAPALESTGNASTQAASNPKSLFSKAANEVVRAGAEDIGKGAAGIPNSQHRDQSGIQNVSTRAEEAPLMDGGDDGSSTRAERRARFARLYQQQ